jgi:hypothetical protein
VGDDYDVLAVGVVLVELLAIQCCVCFGGCGDPVGGEVCAGKLIACGGVSLGLQLSAKGGVDGW